MAGQLALLAAMPESHAQMAHQGIQGATSTIAPGPQCPYLAAPSAASIPECVDRPPD